MRLTALAVTLGCLLALVLGGRPSNLGRRPLRGWPLLAGGIVLQVAAGRALGEAATTPLVVASYLLLIVFAVVNLHLVGMGVVMVGMVANALVIGLNDGMPIRPAAVVAAGLATPEEAERLKADAKRRPERSGDQAILLADIIPIPLMGEVVSFGDLVIGVGIVDTIIHLMKPRRRVVATPLSPATA